MPLTGQSIEFYQYVGPLVLALAGLGLVLLDRHRRIKCFLLVVGLLLGLALYTHAFDAVVRETPLLGTTLKFRMSVLLSFVLACLAALGVDSLQDRNRYLLPAVVLGCAVVTWVLVSRFFGWGSEVKDWMAGMGFLISVVSFVYSRSLGKSLLVGMFFICSQAIWQKSRPEIRGAGPFPPSIAETLDIPEQNAEFRQNCLILGSWSCMPGSQLYYGSRELVGHNLGTIDQHTRAYLQAVDAEILDTRTRSSLSGIDSYPHLLVAGVQRLIVEDVERIPVPEQGYFQQTATLRRNAAVYESDLAIPRISAWPQSLLNERPGDLLPRDFQRIVHGSSVADSENQLRGQIETDEPRMLVFNESYHPGWRAWLNGEEVKPERVLGQFMGLAAPAGKHTVEFRFSPRVFWIGFWWSIVSVLLFVLVAVKVPGRPEQEG